MRIPITETALVKAKKYAEDASDFTHKHRGWENTKRDAQIKRWVTGGVAQNMIEEFCKANKISCVTDSTTHEENDKFDLIIQGFTFDVKASNAGIQCQVNHTSGRKAERGETHCFFFVNVDKSLQWCEPLGFCTSKYYGDHCTRVEKGEIIPWTKRENKYTTFVMENKNIQYKGIESLKKLQYKDF